LGLSDIWLTTMKKPRLEEIAQKVNQINEAAHKVGFLHINSMKISEEA
jgi:hypothetical protein